jgi:hypothetical protein
VDSPSRYDKLSQDHQSEKDLKGRRHLTPFAVVLTASGDRGCNQDWNRRDNWNPFHFSDHSGTSMPFSFRGDTV